MGKVYTGAALKKWFLTHREVFRLLHHNNIGGYSVLNLDKIDDTKHYTVRQYDQKSWVVDEVELITEG